MILPTLELKEGDIAPMPLKNRGEDRFSLGDPLTPLVVFRVMNSYWPARKVMCREGFRGIS